MNTDALKPNVQELQKDVIDLLEQVSSLMERANTAFGSDNSGKGKKYGDFQSQVKNEARKVENLELRMAIVAPMKAGKSTIINAIVGQAILPYRNAAMTTLPTEIVFNAELTTPILKLEPETLSVFKDNFEFLKRADKQKQQEIIAQYPHLEELLQKIKNTAEFPIGKETHGREKIIDALTILNDIIRLCSTLYLFENPLDQLKDIPRIETPIWRSQTAESSKKLGNLVIVDTPGPNEAEPDKAGEKKTLKLAEVVTDQLEKSSIVLIVLDFTQLNSQAADEIKKQVKPVIDARGKENLYVLVNKIDQRDPKKDMNAEQVQQFVVATLQLSESAATDRVFEISAKRAFLATNFLLERQRYRGEITQMKEAEALARQAYGDEWEDIFENIGVEQLQSSAEKVWKKSGFDPFLTKAIDALMKSAAPNTMQTAINVSCAHLRTLKKDVERWKQLISEDEHKLKAQIAALEDDLQDIERRRSELPEFGLFKESLQKKINNIFEEVKQKAKVSIEDYAPTKKDTEKHDNIFATFDIFDILSRSVKPDETVNNIEFKNKAEAKLFIREVNDSEKKRTDKLLSGVKQDTEKQIEEARRELNRLLKEVTQPIIERAQKRLEKAFEIDFVLPSPTIDTNQDIAVKSAVKSDFRYVPGGYGKREVKKRSLFHWFYLVPYTVVEEYEKPAEKEYYYTVDIKNLVTQINSSIKTIFKELNQKTNQYIEEDFKDTFETYFKNLDGYLRDYQDSLKQAQADQKLSVDDQQKLAQTLEDLALEANEKINKADSYFKHTKYWMTDR